MIKQIIKNLSVVLLLFVFCLLSHAQEREQRIEKISFPVIPVIIRYEYAPVYLSQWIENHPQYSMIEAILDSEKGGSLQVIMTGNENRQQVFYSNSEAKINALIMEGKEAHLTKIDFKTEQTDSGHTTYGLAFVDKYKQPILWRVFPTSGPSELGAGLTPFGAVPGLRLEYRDLGTSVGQGTAIQIGDRIIEAELWKEISKPPYFVPYRGSITLGKHIGALMPGGEKWQLIARPDRLISGQEWILKDASGKSRAFKITSQNKDELTVSEVNKPENESTILSMEIHNTAEGFAVRSLTMQNRSQNLRILFSPEVVINSSVTEKKEVAFTIDEGKNKKLVTGIISIEKSGDKLRLFWQPRSPGWAKSRTLETFIKIESTGYSIDSAQAGK